MQAFKKIWRIVLICLVTSILCSELAYARGGGGGSGSSGGGGHSNSGEISNSSSPRYQHGNCFSSVQDQTEKQCNLDPIINIILGFTIFGLALFFIRKSSSAKSFFLSVFHLLIPNKSDPLFREKTEEIFPLFQKAWSEFDMVTLKKITSAKYFELITLELTVLKAEKREDRMENVKLISSYIDPKKYTSVISKNFFKAEVAGVADDTLIDKESQEVLFRDSSSFTEYWTFIFENEEWKLSSIDQSTEDSAMLEPKIIEFSSRNNFFYNPDFGWLMLPTKGVLFQKSAFGTTDVNNHCIGNYKNNIVELYTIKFNVATYLIGQTILPKEYKNVLIRRKKFFEMAPTGLKKSTLESNLFNDEFEVYYAEGDNIAMLELLNPSFMEYIMKLPFILNLELVGNFLYFYTKDIEKADYDKLLEIISRAFEEMKM